MTKKKIKTQHHGLKNPRSSIRGFESFVSPAKKLPFAQNLMSTCRICTSPFSDDRTHNRVSESASPHYQGKTFLFPPQTRCPQCRQRERLSFRNEWTLYKRKCSSTKKDIISIYPDDVPFAVYDQEIWWGDAFDPLSYQRDFDFSRPFFEQFHELSKVVPRSAIQNAKSENCAYTNYSAENKNSYLLVGGFRAEECLYSYRIGFSRDIIDCYDLIHCELCYQCLQSTRLYNCIYARHCHNSSGLVFCEDCIGCQECIGCVNLNNARFHIFNRPYPEREYKEEAAKLKQDIGNLRARFEVFKRANGSREIHLINCEDCTGDIMVNCKDCHCSNSLKESRDCSHCTFGEYDVDCADSNYFDNCTLQFDASNLEQNHRVAKSYLIWYSSDVYYSANCFNSKDLFGCMGMKRNQYCLLNKQYSKTEYETIIPKVIKHMSDTGEWGEFFPPSLTPFAYNETTANDYYPLSASHAAQLGYRFKEELPQVKSDTPAVEVSSCPECSRPWRMIAQETAFYEKMGLSPPSMCPRCRQRNLQQRASR